MKRRGTLASIAAELGVSRTTVSNAYNRPEELTPELRRKILKTAERMGYPGPDPTARSLRTRRAGAIGVLLTEDMTYAFEDQASLDFVSGISVACGSLDCSMLLIPAGVDSAPDPQRAAMLVGQAAVDGFIVYSVASDDPFLAEVRHRGLPMVICDQPRPGGNSPEAFVGINDKEAMKPAVQELVRAGHRNLGILCIRLDREVNNGPVSAERLVTARMDVQRSRVQGALEELAEHGIHDVPIIERHINNADNARSAAQELLTNYPELTAVICTTDSMALGVCEYSAEIGMRIPEDISVTGFDGIPQAIAQGITTIHQPSQQKGIEAGQVLARQIQHRMQRVVHPAKPEALQVENIELATSLVPGKSVAAPRVAAKHPASPK